MIKQLYEIKSFLDKQEVKPPLAWYAALDGAIDVIEKCDALRDALLVGQKDVDYAERED